MLEGIKQNPALRQGYLYHLPFHISPKQINYALDLFTMLLLFSSSVATS